MNRTYVVTGAASGIGQATARLLRDRGHRVIGVDVRSVDVVADLSTAEGRQDGGRRHPVRGRRRLDAVIANAGLSRAQRDDRGGQLLRRGRAAQRARPALAAARAPRAVVTSSMATLMPVSAELVDGVPGR